MKNIFFLIVLLALPSLSCKKDRIENNTGNCKAPVTLAQIDLNDFEGQFFHVDSSWLEGKNLYVHTYGSCVSEPKNTALLFEENLASSFYPTYNLYLADTVKNDFTMDCFATRPMTLCFNLESLLPNSGEAKFSIKSSPGDTLPSKTFFLKK